MSIISISHMSSVDNSSCYQLRILTFDLPLTLLKPSSFDDAVIKTQYVRVAIEQPRCMLGLIKLISPVGLRLLYRSTIDFIIYFILPLA